MIESTEEPSTLICRGCLTEWGELKNMYKWGLDVDFFRYTDISKEPSEGLPELLCSECEADLKKTKDFVERCRQSNQILKRNLRMLTNNGGKANKSNISSIFTKDKLILMINAPDPQEKINLPCPFNCDAEFSKKTLLSNHLKNTHNISESFEIDQRYYCSVDGCVYNLNSAPNKYFSGRKFLNQHYNKTHRDKIYFCDKCKMKFSVQSDLYRHSRSCNMVYTCDICKIDYKTNECYLVHLKRRHPNLHAKYKLDKKTVKCLTLDKSNSKNTIKNMSLKRKISNTECNDVDNIDNVKRFGIIKAAVQIKNDLKGCKSLEQSKPLKVQKLQIVLNPELGNLVSRVQATNNTQVESKRFIHFKDRTIDLGVSMTEEGTVEENVSTNASEESNNESIKEPNLADNVIVEGITTVMNDEENLNVIVDIHSTTPGFVEEYMVQKYPETTNENFKRSFATQIPETIPSDETLNSWTNKTDFEMQTDGISTQTVLDEILSLKPQNGEDEVFFGESVSDIETQTFPFEFPLNRCNKETQFSTSLAPDLSFKETQTCVCFCHTSQPNCRHFGCLISSQNCCNVISAETQTGDSRRLINSDVMLSFSSAETQTCFENSNDSI